MMRMHQICCTLGCTKWNNQTGWPSFGELVSVRILMHAVTVINVIESVANAYKI